MSCSPSASTRTDSPFALKFCTEFHKTLLYKRVYAFFVIVSSRFFKKRISLIQNNSFLWKTYKNQLFQNQWNITKTRTCFCYYCYFLRVNVKKIEKTLFLSAGAQKRWKTAGSGSTLQQYLPNPKTKFPVKLIFT